MEYSTCNYSGIPYFTEPRTTPFVDYLKNANLVYSVESTHNLEPAILTATLNLSNLSTV